MEDQHISCCKTKDKFIERGGLGIKKGKSSIAPLRLPTLATFRSWGSSAGAGRTDLPVQKYYLLLFIPTGSYFI
jgi:hypothetical protein